MVQLLSQAQAVRQALVEEGRLLDGASMTAALDTTLEALNKAVSSGRMFSVEVGAKAYYPAFYASAAYDHKVLESVTRKLGELQGWAKLDFFESHNHALGDLTPLQSLTPHL